MNWSAVPADRTTVLCDVSEGVAQVTLNRPEDHNAFDELMQEELRAVWRWLREDEEVRAVVLTGTGDWGVLLGHRSGGHHTPGSSVRMSPTR
jgi:enoyl-CoA hydratase/carnithine racemase